MITDAVLDFFQTGLLGILGLFPSGSNLPFVSYLTGLYGSLDDLNYFLPIVETFTLVIGVLALFPVFLGITLALWVVAQVRGSSSSG